jgi:hypothetical protein
VTEACDRFEREALQLLEEGQPLPPHFATCPDCQRARGSYERLTKLLSAPGELLESAKWEAGVWEKALPPAGTERSSQSLGRQKAGWKKRWLVAAAAAAAILLGVGQMMRRPAPRATSTPIPLAFHLELAPRRAADTPVRRGSPPSPGSSGGTIFLQPGDELVFDVAAGNARYAEVRLYREDRELQLRCPPGCRRDGDHLLGRFTLPAIGRYQAYLVASENPLPDPEPTLAEDTARLVRSGARIALSPPMQVY